MGGTVRGGYGGRGNWTNASCLPDPAPVTMAVLPASETAIAL